jgi:hypothetical protein
VYVGRLVAIFVVSRRDVKVVQPRSVRRNFEIETRQYARKIRTPPWDIQEFNWDLKRPRQA